MRSNNVCIYISSYLSGRLNLIFMGFSSSFLLLVFFFFNETEMDKPALALWSVAQIFAYTSWILRSRKCGILCVIRDGGAVHCKAKTSQSNVNYILWCQKGETSTATATGHTAATTATCGMQLQNVNRNWVRASRRTAIWFSHKCRMSLQSTQCQDQDAVELKGSQWLHVDHLPLSLSLLASHKK